jgi:CubicO group peptidase (beta-lactamase class C family)
MVYADYVRENILEPMGLHETTPYAPAPRPGLVVARGYGVSPRSGTRLEIENHDTRSMTPALGYYSTVEDLAKFAMWQFRVRDGADDSILKRETLLEMQSLHWQEPAWGLGFTIWDMGGTRFVGHQGGCPGYKSQLIICPDEKIAVAVMVNATDAPQFTLAFRTFEIIAPVLQSPHGDETERGEWSEYAGFYSAAETWSDAEVLPWQDQLAVMWVPGSNPNPVGSLVKLKRIDGEVFRQVTDDGELGKHYIFRRDADGHVVAMKFNNNLLKRERH